LRANRDDCQQDLKIEGRAKLKSYCTHNHLPHPGIFLKAFPINELWDERNRKYLETRYDFRKNAYDWDYNMKLMSKDAKVINSKQYIQWREKGIAFEGREGCYEFPNRTLASGMVVHIKGEKMARRGYFGDIVTSPYIVYGIDPEDKDLLKTTNNVHVQTAADISNITVTSLFHEILHKSKYVATASGREGEDEGPKITEIVEGSDSLTLTEHGGPQCVHLEMQKIQNRIIDSHFRVILEFVKTLCQRLSLTWPIGRTRDARP
jgi:hypothetical protein